jgi:hypothetical protein
VNDVTLLSERFSSLRPDAKAIFLSRVAHMATIAARESYVQTADQPERTYEHPDGIILRDANNFVHRVTGYIPHVLKGTEGVGQDASVIEMIAEYFGEHKLAPYLDKWLENP